MSGHKMSYLKRIGLTVLLGTVPPVVAGPTENNGEPPVEAVYYWGKGQLKAWAQTEEILFFAGEGQRHSTRDVTSGTGAVKCRPVIGAAQSKGFRTASTGN